VYTPLHNYRHLWLWIPAQGRDDGEFVAQAASTTVVPAQAGTHNHRLNCWSRPRPQRCATTIVGGYGSRVKPGTTGSLSRGLRVIHSRSRDMICPSFAVRFALSCRGRREDRVLAAPTVPCAEVVVVMHTSIQVQRTTLRPSLRNGFTAYTCSPRRDWLACHRLRKGACARFTTRHLPLGVRSTRLHRPPRTHSSDAQSAATASHRNTRDDREAPLNRMRWRH
jgi:hypothetical protein